MTARLRTKAGFRGGNSATKEHCVAPPEPESLLSHHMTLDEVNHGFELMEAQDGIRSVITFG
jgi:hypothetical protein